MRTLDARDPAVRLAGVLHPMPGEHGLLLSRLSAAANAQITDPVLSWTGTLPSGVRLALTSDTTAIEVDVQLTRLALGDTEPRPAPFDLVVDGELAAGVALEEGHTFRIVAANPFDIRFEAGASTTVRFDGLAPREQAIELWLPPSASVELLAIRVDDGASLTPSPRPARTWLHHGSSISHCSEADRPTGVWPVVAARRAGVDLTNLALPGQSHVDQFTARAIRDLPADLISCKLGINVVNGDTMRERAFVPAVHGFLDTIRDGHPTTPLVLLTPIVCPVVEDHPGPTHPLPSGVVGITDRPEGLDEGALTLVRIRQLLTEVVAHRQAAGDRHLHLLSGLDLFGPDDLADLPDGLHPNAAGYQRMGDRFHALAFAPGGPFAGPPAGPAAGPPEGPSA